jgi:2,7-dihydroxy-5-methyl-1-naphthoate 7-O-methyltransferase
MDVGGGNGLLLAAILKAHPGLRGVLADQPHVLGRARERGFLAGELAERTRYEPVDFFSGDSLAVPRLFDEEHHSRLG